jgi:hypothetical protein
MSSPHPRSMSESHDADRTPLDDPVARMRDLVQRMRAGHIRSSEMSDPTITVSSLGERGVEALYGIARLRISAALAVAQRVSIRACCGRWPNPIALAPVGTPRPRPEISGPVVGLL